MQELLDEIERNMQRTNGRLDEPLLNKLVKYLQKYSLRIVLRVLKFSWTFVIILCNKRIRIQVCSNFDRVMWPRMQLMYVHHVIRIDRAHLPPPSGK